MPRGADRLSLLGLRGRDIPFCVVGAAAMAVHGVVRSTLGIELLVVSTDVLHHAAPATPGPPDVVAEVERHLAELPDDSRALWWRIVGAQRG